MRRRGRPPLPTIVAALISAHLCLGATAAADESTPAIPEATAVASRDAHEPGDRALSSTVSGGLALPSGEPYASGGWLRATLGHPLSPRLSLYVESGVDALQVSPQGGLAIVPLAAGAALGIEPAPGWEAAVAAAGGGYLAPVLASPYGALLGGGPTVGAAVAVRRYVRESAGVGLAARWSWHVGTGHVWAVGLEVTRRAGHSGALHAQPVDLVPVFPTLRARYAEHGVGTLRLTNTGTFPVAVTEVAASAPPYTMGPAVLTEGFELAAGRSMDVPIALDFGDRLLGVVGDFAIRCYIEVRYRQGSSQRQARISVPLDVVDRNSIVWDETAKACLFVTEKDPAVRGLMGQVANAVRARPGSLVAESFEIATATLAALDAYALAYLPDPASPYASARAGNTVDYIRFPRETLADRVGDCDDLAVLYCALLESAGMETALITVPGHILVAVSLEMETALALRRFAHGNALLDVGGTAWLPLETTVLGDAVESWRRAARQYHDAHAAGEAEFVRVRDAWARYPPVALRTADTHALTIDEAALEAALERVAAAVVESEMTPLAAALRESIASGGSRVGRDYNRLGVLYASYGELEDARAAFRAAFERTGYAPAQVNLANVLVLLGEFEEALELYEAYESQHGESAAVALGLSLARFRLADYDGCARAYERLAWLAPGLASESAYLVVRTMETIEPARAAVRAWEVVWVD